MFRSMYARKLVVLGIAVSLAACSGASTVVPSSSTSPQSQGQTKPVQFSLHLASLPDPSTCPGGKTVPANMGIFSGLSYAQGGGGDPATIDATGCAIGIFIGPGDKNLKLDHIQVTGASIFGIAVYNVDGAHFDHIQISNIGSPTTLGAALLFDGATNVSLDHTDLSQYSTFGFVAIHDSSFKDNHTTATGQGPGWPQVQAGFVVADSTDIHSDHPDSINHSSTTANPAIPYLGGNSYAYLLCDARDSKGNPLTVATAANHPSYSGNSNDVSIVPACPPYPY